MTRKLALCLVIFSGGFTTLADHGNLRCGPNIGNMYYQFDLADGPETIRRHEPVLMPEITGENRDGIYTTHQSALKTVLAIRIASTIQDALQDFAKSNKELNERVVLAHRLSDAALELEQFAWDLAMTKGFGSEFFAPINGIRTLADNIKNYDPRPTFHGFSLSPFRVHPKLNVTAGGPQNAGHYNKLLFFGKVPEPGDFTMEGFLSEFDLSIDEATSDEYLLVKPVSAYDAYNKKLYVQLAMGTSVRSESFMRKPLNLTVVLDTSISMVADDNTGTSRLDWSKQMIDQIVNQLRKDDLFSLVIFDQEAQTLLDGANIGGSDIKTGYSSIAVGSVTNLFAGLKRGFDLASKHRQRDYENRVVLISDAGLNWGITDSTDLLRLVSDHAAENIGLTVIGIGDDFNEAMTHQLTRSKGGNYGFVESGAELLELVNEFNYLISPAAYNFKVELELARQSFTLARAYGVPMRETDTVMGLVDVSTLFFTGFGAGAIVFEFDVDN